MGKTFKDNPKGNPKLKYQKPKEGRRFVPSKGRKEQSLKELLKGNPNRSLEDYFI